MIFLLSERLKRRPRDAVSSGAALVTRRLPRPRYRHRRRRRPRCRFSATPTHRRRTANGQE